MKKVEMANEEKIKALMVATPKTEMLFPSLLEEAKYEGDKQGHYEVTLLMNPDQKWDDVRNAVAESSKQFKSKKWFNPIRKTMQDGSHPPWLPEGWEFLKVKKSIQKRDDKGFPITTVNIVDGKKNKLSGMALEEAVFTGMVGKVVLYVIPYTKGGNGVSCRIDTIQALGGERRALGLNLLDVEDTEDSEDEIMSNEELMDIYDGKAA